MDFDVSELQRLAADLEAAGAALAEKVRPVVQRGALNIKTQMQAELSESRHFKGITSSVTYDTVVSPTGIEAQVGPDKNRGGALANVAYFGTSRGGGTVPDPQGALDAETPRFLKALGDAMEDLL